MYDCKGCNERCGRRPSVIRKGNFVANCSMCRYHDEDIDSRVCSDCTFNVNCSFKEMD